MATNEALPDGLCLGKGPWLLSRSLAPQEPATAWFTFCLKLALWRRLWTGKSSGAPSVRGLDFS